MMPVPLSEGIRYTNTKSQWPVKIQDSWSMAMFQAPQSMPLMWVSLSSVVPPRDRLVISGHNAVMNRWQR